ncbi:hypothetical protein [Phytoactinopolyspora mesophila]|uniref:PQQ-binding-like beta-propeller repeat protein n=1 Tax=Phytoactinopolyspora mesophila TaxID=2650750 RepID=A0A7K3LYY3_9ACTN|nr:hypothetical protein [Phytoactinopolyspora mesophila]NDL56243.1 hypothetical protein [Phytoactinopolyspora mesophila]
MNRRLGPRALAIIAITLPAMLAGCGLFGDDTPELELVAGGGDDPQGATRDEVSLPGYAADLVVADGTVYLLASDEHGDKRLVTAAADGSVSHMPLDFSSAQYLAAGPEGQVYAASESEIRRLDTDPLEPIIVSAGTSAAENSDALVVDATIQGLAVDAEGFLIWAESFLGTGPDGGEPALVRVNRLVDGHVEHVAGASETDHRGQELMAWQESPPDGMAAVDLPLRRTGGGGALAAGESGLYLGSSEGILHVDNDGSVAGVVGAGERGHPDGPFADDRDAQEFGGAWAYADMDTSGDVFVGVDSALSDQPVAVDAFEWSGDFSDGAEELAAKIGRSPRADGSLEHDHDRSHYGDVAVVVHDGQAATAMAHVTKVAVEDGRLYAVGQTRQRSSSHIEDAEMLLVAMELPEDWR